MKRKFFFSCVSLSMFHESSMRFVRNTKSNYIIQQSWTKTDVKNGKNHNTKCVWNEVKTLLENCERNVKCLSLTRFSQCKYFHQFLFCCFELNCITDVTRKCRMLFEMQCMYWSACVRCAHSRKKKTRKTEQLCATKPNKFYLLQLLNIVSIECNLWCDFGIIRPMWYFSVLLFISSNSNSSSSSIQNLTNVCLCLSVQREKVKKVMV